jgi:hypothetical protein
MDLLQPSTEPDMAVEPFYQGEHGKVRRQDRSGGGAGISEARISCFVAEGARVAFGSAWPTTHRRAFM